MNGGSAWPPTDRHIPELREALPVLTEVIRDDGGERASAGALGQVGVPVSLGGAVTLPVSGLPGAPMALAPEIRDPLEGAMQAVDEERVAREVLSSLQGQVDRLFEFRLKTALEPVLQTLVADVVKQAREELAVVMSDVVRRAVSQELARRKAR